MKVRMFSKMIIAECLSNKQTEEFESIVERLSLNTDSGFQSCQILTEQDGRMVVIILTFTTQDGALGNHGNLWYRQLVKQTQHLLIGDFVVKMFEERQTVGAA